MSESVYPVVSPELAKRRREWGGPMFSAFRDWSRQVFAEGALPVKTKQLIALAVAHVTQCPYCIESHTKLALAHGATREEIMEAIWVATEMRAGAAYAHSAVAIKVLHEAEQQQAPAS